MLIHALAATAFNYTAVNVWAWLSNYTSIVCVYNFLAMPITRCWISYSCLIKRSCRNWYPILQAVFFLNVILLTSVEVLYLPSVKHPIIYIYIYVYTGCRIRDQGKVQPVKYVGDFLVHGFLLAGFWFLVNSCHLFTHIFWIALLALGQ